MILASIATVGLTSFAAPEAVPTPQVAPVERLAVEKATGTVQSVDVEAGEFTLSVEAGDVTISFSGRTKYMLDGKESTRARVLVVGNEVTVEHQERMATSVSARTAPGRS